MGETEADQINALLLAPLRQQGTGVQGIVIWIAAGEFSAKDAQHGPRIKVMLGTNITTERFTDAVSVKLTSPPEVIGDLPDMLKEQVVAFVEANREVLLQYWRNELDTAEMIALLTRIEWPPE